MSKPCRLRWCWPAVGGWLLGLSCWAHMGCAQTKGPDQQLAVFPLADNPFEASSSARGGSGPFALDRRAPQSKPPTPPTPPSKDPWASPTRDPAASASESASESASASASFSPTRNPSALLDSIAQHVLVEHRIHQGDLLHQAFEALATSVGWTFLWYPAVSWRAIANIDLSAYKDPTLAIIELVKVMRQEGKPIQLLLYASNRVMEVLSTEVRHD